MASSFRFPERPFGSFFCLFEDFLRVFEVNFRNASLNASGFGFGLSLGGFVRKPANGSRMDRGFSVVFHNITGQKTISLENEKD